MDAENGRPLSIFYNWSNVYCNAKHYSQHCVGARIADRPQQYSIEAYSNPLGHPLYSVQDKRGPRPEKSQEHRHQVSRCLWNGHQQEGQDLLPTIFRQPSRSCDKIPDRPSLTRSSWIFRSQEEMRTWCQVRVLTFEDLFRSRSNFYVCCQVAVLPCLDVFLSRGVSKCR